MTLECDHCRAALRTNARACDSCGAPLKAAQLELLAGRRNTRIRRGMLVVLLLGAVGGGATWRATRRPPQPPAKVSTDPYAQKVTLTVDFEDSRANYRGDRERWVAVLVENTGESSVACVRVSLRVLDAAGAEVRHDARDLRCAHAGPLWPGERTVAGFVVPELEPTERFDLVVEDLTLGPPPAGAPELRPMTVSVSPAVGVADVAPFLEHELRMERLDAHDTFGSQTIAFTVSAIAPLEVSELAYELRVVGPGGEPLGTGYAPVASHAERDGMRFPTLRPGRPVSMSITAGLGKPLPGAHWELFVTRFASRQPSP